MRSVENTFSKSQLKLIILSLRNTKYKFPLKYKSILDLLKKEGFIFSDGKIIPDPDYKEEIE